MSLKVFAKFTNFSMSYMCVFYMCVVTLVLGTDTNLLKLHSYSTQFNKIAEFDWISPIVIDFIPTQWLDFQKLMSITVHNIWRATSFHTAVQKQIDHFLEFAKNKGMFYLYAMSELRGVSFLDYDSQNPSGNLAANHAGWGILGAVVWRVNFSQALFPADIGWLTYAFPSQCITQWFNSPSPRCTSTKRLKSGHTVHGTLRDPSVPQVAEHSPSLNLNLEECNVKLAIICCVGLSAIVRAKDSFWATISAPSFQ